MASELRLRRGNAVQHATFIGADSEVTVNSDSHSIHVHDGVTAGGFELARKDLGNISNAAFLAKAVAAGVDGGAGGGGGGGGGAPLDAAYLVLSNDDTLTGERRLQLGPGITGTDAGAGGAYVLGANFSAAAPLNLGSATAGTSNAVARADHVHAMPTATDVGAVPASRQIIAGTGLTGGGPLSNSVTLSLNAKLSNLTDVFMTTTPPTNGDLLIYNGATSRWENSQTYQKLSIQQNGVGIGATGNVKTLNFLGNGATLIANSTDNSIVNLTISQSVDAAAVETVVGNLVTAGTKSGLSVVYNQAQHRIDFAANNFQIALQGDVQGIATVNALGNTTMNTVIAANSVVLGTNTRGAYVASVAAGSGISVNNSASANGAVLTLGLNTNDAGYILSVQNIIGQMVSGANLETGVTVTYDANNKLNFVASNFSVTLAGAVSGTATVSGLSNTTINTTLPANSVILGTHTSGNYVASATGQSGISVSGSGSAGAALVLGLDTSHAGFIEGAQDAVGLAITAGDKRGMTVVYDDSTNRINFSANDFTVALTGPVLGTATVAGLANTVITTSLATNSVTLGYHTTGRYVGTVTAGNAITITNTEGATANSALVVAVNTADANFIKGSQDAFSALIANGTATGITYNYDAANRRLNTTANSFTLTLNGALSGVTTVNSLTNTVLNATLANSSVILGQHTSGAFVQTLAVSGPGFSLANGGGDAAQLTLTSTATANTTPNTIVYRDATGSFAAGTITASLSGNASTAGRLQTARTITLAGDATGSVSFDGSSNVTLTATLKTIGSISAGSYSNPTMTVDAYGRITAIASGSSSSLTSAGTITAYNTSPAQIIVGADTTNGSIEIGLQGRTSAGTPFIDFHSSVNSPDFDVRLMASGGSSAASGGGSLTVQAASILPAVNNAMNIGSGSAVFANMYATLFNGTATSARYADLAERYAADAAYEPGTVVVFGGEQEITMSRMVDDRRLAGVISTAPAVMMNSEAGSDETHPYVALVGRVPCKVVGPVLKGQMLTTSSVPGHASATSTPLMGTIIGKSLEDKLDDAPGVIEISVQRY